MSQRRTCLDCGFLTIQGRELSRPDRIMLGSHGQSVMPAHPEQTRCFKDLWDYELYYSGDSFDGVVEEIGRPRDECPGFATYEAGFSPAQHLENQVEQRKEKLQWRVAKLGFWGALVGAIAGAIAGILILALLEWLLG